MVVIAGKGARLANTVSGCLEEGKNLNRVRELGFPIDPTALTRSGLAGRS